jgi:pimeloyl-ACP methyl ester carboxylesterase
MASLGGCIAVPTSHSVLSLSRDEGRAELERLSAAPVSPLRPVVILSGYHTPAIHAQSLQRALIKATGAPAENFLIVSYVGMTNFDSVAEHTLRKVEERWPSANVDETQPVDVIGISMGGLIGRYCAITPDKRSTSLVSLHIGGGADAAANSSQKRLNVQRLFTFSSPHRGALFTRAFAPDRLARDMRSGSAFLARLDRDRAENPFEMVCRGEEHGPAR